MYDIPLSVPASYSPKSRTLFSIHEQSLVHRFRFEMPVNQSGDGPVKQKAHGSFPTQKVD